MKNKREKGTMLIYMDLSIMILVVINYAISLWRGRFIQFFMFMTVMIFIRLVGRDMNKQIKEVAKRKEVNDIFENIISKLEEK